MTHSRDRSKATRGLVPLGGAPVRKAGAVTLVGAGPGDPELLTIKALKALQAAEVVVHDGLVSDEILELAPASARRISVAKRKSRHSYSQDEINRMLVAFAQDGLEDRDKDLGIRSFRLAVQDGEDGREDEADGVTCYRVVSPEGFRA